MTHVMYQAAVNVWGLAPSEFWKMTPGEWWLLYEGRNHHNAPTTTDWGDVIDQLGTTRINPNRCSR